MTLVTCTECGSFVAEGTKTCPDCGHPTAATPVLVDVAIANLTPGNRCCTDCGSSVRSGAQACTECGCPVTAEPEVDASAADSALACASCGNSASQDAKYCAACGRPLYSDAASPAHVASTLLQRSASTMEPAHVHTPKKFGARGVIIGITAVSIIGVIGVLALRSPQSNRPATFSEAPRTTQPSARTQDGAITAAVPINGASTVTAAGGSSLAIDTSPLLLRGRFTYETDETSLEMVGDWICFHPDAPSSVELQKTSRRPLSGGDDRFCFSGGLDAKRAFEIPAAKHPCGYEGNAVIEVTNYSFNEIEESDAGISTASLLNVKSKSPTQVIQCDPSTGELTASGNGTPPVANGVTPSEPVDPPAGDVEVAEDAASGAVAAAQVPKAGVIDPARRAMNPPRYPPEEMRRHVTGDVVLRLRYDAGGTVQDVQVLSSAGNSNLDKAAVTAAKQWKIQPRIENGAAAAGELTTTVSFTL